MLWRGDSGCGPEERYSDCAPEERVVPARTNGPLRTRAQDNLASHGAVHRIHSSTGPDKLCFSPPLESFGPRSVLRKQIHDVADTPRGWKRPISSHPRESEGHSCTSQLVKSSMGEVRCAVSSNARNSCAVQSERIVGVAERIREGRVGAGGAVPEQAPS
eukprot:CAMPEP_0175886760 /NCGR_PEP_ID=MMETSP0107_2-20121207/45809_1 /TAXON_ID=195067 ORGANISM="Goniomonas pacifica, Strain CCMP1869" /NCGR_SAMPLE_ID=MMETSP0107_2 /ASSEMBLY_ACC=CAM_ASM_000203 /LENGTH=159 /DNA_ID=CAMNT_0017207165 /DNA_START=347 /DNA_END=823 /DNA_ORIENTATION=-